MKRARWLGVAGDSAPFYQHKSIYLTYYSTLRDVGWDSSVAVVTRYGLDGPGIESRWGRDFPQTGPGAHPTSYTMGTGSFPGGQAAGA
jgi:hypothetical protein